MPTIVHFRWINIQFKKCEIIFPFEIIITFMIINPINAMIEDFDRLEKNNIQDKVPTSVISEISQLIKVYIKLKHKVITKLK